GVAAAKVQRAGARNGDLRHQPGVGLDELEIRRMDRMAPAHAAVDQRDRLRAAASWVAAGGVLAGDGVDAEVAELAVEEAVIGAAAEFTVGRKLEANTLLQRQCVLDGR